MTVKTLLGLLALLASLGLGPVVQPKIDVLYGQCVTACHTERAYRNTPRHPDRLDVCIASCAQAAGR